MGRIVAYEIQTYQSGDWKIDSVFDDRELATFDAKRMEESGRYSAIRIVEETYDSETDLAKTRIVFRSSKVDESNEATKVRRRSQGTTSSARPKSGGGAQRTKSSRKPAQKGKPVHELKMFWSVVFVGVGLILLLSFISNSL